MVKKLLFSGVIALVALKAQSQTYQVDIKTNKGDISLVLADNTPLHRDNMVKLVKEKFYNGTLFHRVIPQFVIQGGDPQSKTADANATLGGGDIGYKVPAEINSENFHFYGAVGMARDNNPEKASSGCQFYIVTGKKYAKTDLEPLVQRSQIKANEHWYQQYESVGGTPHLDGGYTVFGKVVKGMDVVESVANEPRNGQDRPNQNVIMEKVTVKKIKAKKRLKSLF